MIAGVILCASLTAVDGDTVKCDGQNMRLLGEGVPLVSGIDTPDRQGQAGKSCWLKRDCVSYRATRRRRTGRSSTSIERMEKRSGKGCFGKDSPVHGARSSETIGVVTD